MKKLTQYLASIGADNYFNEMNLSINELFLSDSIEVNPYYYHKWGLRKNDEMTVVNAIPEEDRLNHLIWERWYIFHNEVHHQILSLWRPSSYDDIFDCPEKDDIQPEQSFGKRWYVIEDPDMKPLLLRR